MPAMSLYDPRLARERYAPQTLYYYDRVWNGYHMQTHVHPQVEIMYAISGRCKVFYTLSGEDEQCFCMEPGDYILIDSSIPHRLDVDDGCPCRMKNIEFVFAAVSAEQVSFSQLITSGEDMRALLRRRSSVLTGRDPQGDLLRAFDSLLTFYLYSLENPHADAVTQHAFSMLLLTVAYLQAQTDSSGAVHLRKALAYIQTHFAEKLPLPEIAQAAGVHPVYLQRLFKQSLGRTVVDYITDRRIERAAYLLRHTDVPAAQIAMQSGFGSRQQFYRSFLKQKGLSPQDYRLKHRT